MLQTLSLHFLKTMPPHSYHNVETVIHILDKIYIRELSDSIQKYQ